MTYLNHEVREYFVEALNRACEWRRRCSGAMMVTKGVEEVCQVASVEDLAFAALAGARFGHAYSLISCSIGDNEPELSRLRS